MRTRQPRLHRIHGELIPREVAEIETVGDFLSEMSDLISTSLLFVLTLVAAFGFVRVLRGSLTKAVNACFAEADDAALTSPLEPTGDLARDVERLRARANARAGLLRAVVFQREVNVVGSRTMAVMVTKALVPLATTAFKRRKMLGL